MKSIQLPVINVTSIFKRFHLTLFIIFITATLSGTVLLINYVILNPSSGDEITPNTSQNLNGSLTNMRSLHTSDEFKIQPLQHTGRESPFTE